jgi:hypothetical protein
MIHRVSAYNRAKRECGNRLRVALQMQSFAALT